MYVNSGSKMTDITDGTSNTLLVGERPPSENLVFGWMWAGAGDGPAYGTTDIALGVREIVPIGGDYTSVAPPGVQGQNPYPLNQTEFFRPGELRDPQDRHRYHFWSLHVGGSNWLFGDGSVRFVSYAAGQQSIGVSVATGIAPMTFMEALASRNGGEVSTNIQ